MKRTVLVAVVTVGSLAPAAARAQEQGSPTPVLARTASPVQAPVEGRRILIDAMETRITPDRPYSAEAVTETTQALADGNRIHRQSVTRVYRDSAGRTRRETLAPDGTVQTISISDPVAGVNYSLDPRANVAYKTAGTMIAATRTAGGTRLLELVKPSEAGAPHEERVTTRRATTTDGSGSASITRSRESGGGAGGRRGAVATVTGSLKRDALEPQNIEGVSATGSRTTTTIPAGQVGNAQEMKIVSEQWFAEELQLLVMTRHSDPRSGETTYRLRNILRAEPDPSLFTVPADYTVQDRTMRR